MFRRIKNIIKNNERQNEQIIEQNRTIILQNQEVLWSQIFRDAIKGKPCLQNLPLNVGRWAGNYSFFYVLFRVLDDIKPREILELGLGETSKFISAYINNYLPETKHYILEQNESWKSDFLKKNKLASQSAVIVSPIKTEIINGEEVKVFSSLAEVSNLKFDFLVIDGPFGSEHYSRYDAFKLIENIDESREFVLLMDDYDRKGEQETIELIIEAMKKKGVYINKAVYTGAKSLFIMSTNNFPGIGNF